jgi:hypothetical protein
MDEAKKSGCTKETGASMKLKLVSDTFLTAMTLIRKRFKSLTKIESSDADNLISV